MKSQVLDTVSQVNQTLLITFGIAVFFFLLITVCLVIFVIRYNHSKRAEAADIRGSKTLEIIWIVIPAIIVLGMFYSGWQSYLSSRTVPGNAMPVLVTARKWSWTFTYENGRISNILYALVNRPIKLTLTSVDVIHSFYAPAFRIKRDAVPGMNTYVWFLPEKPGDFDILCTEYCGVGHSAMLTKIKVLSADAFTDWYEKGKVDEQAAGMELLVKYGCIGCHQMGEVKGVGPTLQGVYGKDRKVNTASGEKTVTADESYVKRSILAPNEDVVIGYPPIMPAYNKQISDEDLNRLLEYIESLQ
jgi:cytochrome c oxidase subunit II